MLCSGMASYGEIWSGEAVMVTVRRGGRVKAWSVPLRLVKAVQVCWGLVSWVTAWRFRFGRVRRGVVC